MLTITAILDAARAGREAVRVLCEGLTAEELRAEIERLERPDAWTTGIRDLKPIWGPGMTAAEIRDLTIAAPTLPDECARVATCDEGRVYLYLIGEDRTLVWSANERRWVPGMKRASTLRPLDTRRSARLARAALETERDRRSVERNTPEALRP